MLNRRFLRIRAAQAIYAYFKSEISLSAAEKNLEFSLLKSYELEALVFWLIVEVRRYAQHRIEAGLKKQLPTDEELNPNTQFVDNRVIERIAASELARFTDEHKLSWHRNGELIKHLYTRLIESEYYAEYMSRPAKFNDDMRLVVDFYQRTVLDDELFETTVEEQSIGWNDAVEYAVELVCLRLERDREDILFLMPPQYSNEEDSNFAYELLDLAVQKWDKFRTLVERFADNWDTERIAQMDMILMVMALIELTFYPSIPVKVTIDEYIEIAKFYSTPTSGQFINGVLDKAVSVLTEEGEISKSGRGLME